MLLFGQLFFVFNQGQWDLGVFLSQAVQLVTYFAPLDFRDAQLLSNSVVI